LKLAAYKILMKLFVLIHDVFLFMCVLFVYAMKKYR
jgi:hypothetical protein